ncbi:sentrin-specific protease 1 [Drosophila rhopaloa]|uniref:Sentrin-specific protease 1 n=1 Tax=Drosophila rhopaloa TaxID=1041015 RepID=A0A6P4E8A2_DRORH|nr:sentrin-specific protease 1 [Drosophila rhopaloa]
MDNSFSSLFSNGADRDYKTMTEQVGKNRQISRKSVAFLSHRTSSGSQTQVANSLLVLERQQLERERYIDLIRNQCYTSPVVKTNPVLQQGKTPQIFSSTNLSSIDDSMDLKSTENLTLANVNPVTPSESSAQVEVMIQAIHQHVIFIRKLTSNNLVVKPNQSAQTPKGGQNNGEVKQQVNTSPVHKMALQRRRFTSSMFLKDDYVENFRQRSAQKDVDSKKLRERAIQKAEKVKKRRLVFERGLYEKFCIDQDIPKPTTTYTANNTVEKEENGLIPMTNEDFKYLTNLAEGDPQQVLVNKFNINITRSEIQILVNGRWLNDVVINFYMNLLTERSEKSRLFLPSVYAMNTFFVPRLLQSGHAGVKRWTRKVDIFSKDIIPVPVHYNNVHWGMAIIHMRNKTILYYDSLGKGNQKVLDALEEYLWNESLDKRNQSFDTRDFRISNVKGLPRQGNNSDCGVFSCMFAEYLTRYAPLTFTQDNVDYFRKKMALEIVDGKLWL